MSRKSDRGRLHLAAPIAATLVALAFGTAVAAAAPTIQRTDKPIVFDGVDNNRVLTGEGTPLKYRTGRTQA